MGTGLFGGSEVDLPTPEDIAKEKRTQEELAVQSTVQSKRANRESLIFNAGLNVSGTTDD